MLALTSRIARLTFNTQSSSYSDSRFPSSTVTRAAAKRGSATAPLPASRQASRMRSSRCAPARRGRASRRRTHVSALTSAACPRGGRRVGRGGGGVSAERVVPRRRCHLRPRPGRGPEGGLGGGSAQARPGSLANKGSFQPPAVAMATTRTAALRAPRRPAVWCVWRWQLLSREGTSLSPGDGKHLASLAAFSLRVTTCLRARLPEGGGGRGLRHLPPRPSSRARLPSLRVSAAPSRSRGPRRAGPEGAPSACGGLRP